MELSKVFQRALGIKPKDKVLVITDKIKMPLAKKVYSACLQVSKNTKMVRKPVGVRSGEEPPKKIANMMKRNNVVIALTKHSLTHTNARREACKLGVKIATMPGFTKEMWKTLEADPYQMNKVCEKIRKRLKKANIVRITTNSGTDITFSIKKRLVDIDDGLFIKRPRNFGNLPAGETSVSPTEGTANGVITINSMEDYAKPGTYVVIKKGNAVYISDNKCKLAKTFKTVLNATNLAELGIGVNPTAKIIGNILQDEKVKGTCHLAFGSNLSYRGKIYSPFHLDAILLKPTIWLDNKLFMKEGKIIT